MSDGAAHWVAFGAGRRCDIRLMKRSICALLLINFCCLLSVVADENVRAAQTRLREDGFYFATPDGVYDSRTAAAVTRYQIRHGLQINGKLDASTAKALGLGSAASTVSEPPAPVAGTWRQLRNGEQQFIPATQKSDPVAKKSPSAKEGTGRAPAADSGRVAVERKSNDFGLERVRDYVGAFVLAGLDPKVGSELEFFADRVDYFGENQVSRERIRRDLRHYDSRWPERRFWLAGKVDIRALPKQRLRVTFPLRYELRSPSEKASGTVRKTLHLEKTGGNDLVIIAVNEKKIR